MCKLKGRTHRKRKKKLETEDNKKWDIRSSENLKLFYKWIGKMGYKPCKKLKPKVFQESGRGLMAGERISAGDTIIAIPENLLITTEVVAKSEIGLFFTKYFPKATGHQMLSVFLMLEKAKGNLSEWYYYIKTLPKHYNIPAFYGRRCLPLMPAFIKLQATKQIETVEESYKELCLLMKELEGNFPFLHGCLTFEEFKWSWSTVNTRCVFIDCLKKDCIGKLCSFHLALAPFLDLLNHNVGTQVQAGFNRSTKQYEIVSLCNFQKYSQVFINYGYHDNCNLFLEYGFVLPNNANDTILFTLDDIVSAYQRCNFTSKTLERKLKFILENDLIKNSVCSCDGLSWNLNIILKILEADYDIEKWKTLLCCPLEEDGPYFGKLCKELLLLKLQEYATISTSLKNCPLEYSVLQQEIYQLLEIHTSILLKFT